LRTGRGQPLEPRRHDDDPTYTVRIEALREELDFIGSYEQRRSDRGWH
jgi:hypothetical protein